MFLHHAFQVEKWTHKGIKRKREIKKRDKDVKQQHNERQRHKDIEKQEGKRKLKIDVKNHNSSKKHKDINIERARTLKKCKTIILFLFFKVKKNLTRKET